MTLTGEEVELVRNSLISPEPDEAGWTIPETIALDQVNTVPGVELVAEKLKIVLLQIDGGTGIKFVNDGVGLTVKVCCALGVPLHPPVIV